ncbi:MAG: hydratase [Spirochaetaceae bacterium]|jgi:aconitate hydratase|nr:hydratase [Spirochaetaceae bacterium]
MKIIQNKVYLLGGREIIADTPENQHTIAKKIPAGLQSPQGSIAGRILAAHNKGTGTVLKLHFDAAASHDITYVNIVQTARVSGLDHFTMPYILTNCHNSLCAVGGTINADDHAFGLSVAQKYGALYVPAHLAVIHTFIRETVAGCGKMILGSDSHTRYGALGTLGVGEGGGELVKQLLGQSYTIEQPPVIAIYLTGKPRHGVGPHDVALSLIKATFKSGLVKNAILEFVGDGIAALPADFRSGIDVMTTETTCWSSIWETDETIREYFSVHGRAEDYQKLSPEPVACYDGMIVLDLAAVKPQIALPFHPAQVYDLDELLANPGDIFRQVEKDAAMVLENPALSLKLLDKIDDKGRIIVDQEIIAGCAGGTFDNIMAAAAIMERACAGGSLSVYPGSQPLLLQLSKNGGLSTLLAAGALVRTAFCGPCFGAGDVPHNEGFSIRHSTRNFPHREGSKPAEGQIASVALMDARSIAATAAHNNILSSAEFFDFDDTIKPYHFDDSPYRNQVYYGFGKPEPSVPLHYGPNIADWPPLPALGEHLLIKIVSFITDPVTTTDEIIPSGETASFRSNPLKLAAYTLSRKDPLYVARAQAVQKRTAPELPALLERIKSDFKIGADALQIGSGIFAKKPGDGSAREQAASCQRVLGGVVNFANEYATKRYRSNLINWGILPFIIDSEPPFVNEDYLFIPYIRQSLVEGVASLPVYVLNHEALSFSVSMPSLNAEEKEIIIAGCLINWNRNLTQAAFEV